MPFSLKFLIEMRAIVGLFFVLITSVVSAQHTVVGGTVGYQYQSGSWAKLGGYVQFVGSGSSALKVDAGVNTMCSRGDWKFVPEVGLSIYPNANHLLAPFVELEGTPYTVTPKLGVSLVHFVELSLGYGFSYRETDYMKSIRGVQVGLTIQLPLNYGLN